MIESRLYKKIDAQTVQCLTCHHHCRLKKGRRGICGVRENINGKLMVLNYGKLVAVHVDPIEKKPLYRFLPGTLTYSIATVGCNFRCLHCQNADISQYPKNFPQQDIPGTQLTPQQVVTNALHYHCPSIAYTYTEPTIFLEYALDTMQLAHQQGLKNVWVSNGYMSQEALQLIMPNLDAINVDLKAMTEKFYQQVCGARLQPVLDNLITLKKQGIHLEVTTLIIPTQNDSPQELKQIAEFIKNKLGADTPWHVTAFYPTYKMRDVPPTPQAKVLQAVEIGHQAGLEYVYPGNI